MIHRYIENCLIKLQSSSSPVLNILCVRPWSGIGIKLTNTMCKFLKRSAKTLVRYACLQQCPKAVVFPAEGRIETRFGSVLVSIHSLGSLLNRRTLKLAHGVN